MRTLDRHVLAECGWTSLLATGAFVFILVAGNVAQQVIGAVSSGRVDGWQALELLWLLVPTVLPYALPMGLLTGVLMSFGRMGADSEITAMKSAGVSLWRIATPVWLGAAMLAAFSAWLNLEAGPRAEADFQRILVGSAGTNPASLIIPGKLNRQFKGLLIRVESKEGDLLRGFRLWQMDEKGGIREVLHAATARLALAEDNNGVPVLRVRLSKAQLTARDGREVLDLRPENFTSAEEATLEFPREDSGHATSVKRLRMMTAGELIHAMDAGWELAPDALPADKAREVMRLKVQLMFRLATALSVFSLSMLAVPLAVSVGRSDTSVNAGLALGVALTYYLMTSMATWVKVPSLHPESLVLLPNFLVIGVASWLMRRAASR